MPIRVLCQCGTSLNVPDSMAGKTGKCPKCAKPILIPPLKPSQTESSRRGQGTPAPVVQSATNVALERLFIDAGLDKKKDPECPSCKATIRPGSAICVSCGLNFETGERLQGLQTAVDDDELGSFNNFQLDRAAQRLKKEQAEELELQFVGSPWWVSLAVVLGLITFIYFGVIYVEGMNSSDASGGGEPVSMKASPRTFQGRIQRQTIQNLLIVVMSLISVMVVSIASFVVQIKAYRDSIGKGIMTSVVPFYILYYSIVEKEKLRATSRILWIWTVVALVFVTLLLITKSYRVFTG